MAKFTAGSAVPALEWDFTRYQPRTDPPGTAWAGVIREPSQGAIRAFQEQAKAAAPTGDVERLSETEDTDLLAALKGAVAELCGGDPSQAMLDALPFRVLTAFIGWLIGQLGNPQ